MQVQTLGQTLFNFLYFGKSRFPPKNSFITSTLGELKRKQKHIVVALKWRQRGTGYWYFFKFGPFTGSFFFLFVISIKTFLIQLTENKFADDWIRPTDIWRQNRQLYQLSQAILKGPWLLYLENKHVYIII